MAISGTDVSESTGSTSKSLVRRLKSAEPSAWETLVKLYGPLVYHWCRRSNLSADDSADLLQTVLQKAFRSIALFGSGRSSGSFRGWLLTITRNAISDHFRKLASQPAGRGGTTALKQIHDIPDAGARDDEQFTSGAAVTELHRRALDLIRTEFNEPTWRAFELMIFQGCTASEAGAEVGMSGGAVRVAKCRILRRLREELGDV